MIKKKLLLFLSLFLTSTSGIADVKVENFTFERTVYLDSTYIIVSTDKTTNVKCAIFDKNDKPIRVSEDTVTPPLSELIVLSSDAVITSVQCWEQEPGLYEKMLENVLLELTESLEEVEPIKLPSALLEKMFPSIEGKDFYTDEIVKVSDLLANKMSLVNVWASWCTTCRKEHQMIMNIAKNTDLQLIGIDYRDTREEATKYLAALGNPFDEIIFDPSGSIGMDLGVYATPETFLVNEKGVILYKHIGEINQKVWDENFAIHLKPNQLSAEEQYRQLLAKEVQDEQDTARSLIIEDQLNTLRSAYINNIAARIKTFWRYQSAEDDWTAEVYVVQDRDGNVRAVDVKNSNVGDSDRAKSFMNSIERAVYKASPFPGAPDKAVFDKELYIIFTVK